MIRTFVLVLLMAAGFGMTAPAAQAHSWYPLSCCSENDCEPIPAGGIEETAGGFRVHYRSARFGMIDSFISSDLVKLSQDSNFHGCWQASARQPKVICFFAPFNV